MTSSLRPEPCDHRQRQTSPARGFTLIEMLVVIGIILVLLGILLPSAGKAYKESVRNSMRADLNAISQALEAYKNDFGDYPRPGQFADWQNSSKNNTVFGPEILCWALIAPGPVAMNPISNSTPPGGDGAAGPGFRKQAIWTGTQWVGQGQVYGPYLSLDRFKIGTRAAGTNIVVNSATAYSDLTTVIADRYGNVILYFPRNAAANTATLNGYASSKGYALTPNMSQYPAYNYQDANGAFPTVQEWQAALPGCSRPLTAPNNQVPTYNAGGASTLPYFLMSAGPDGKFGRPTTNYRADDVTNFD